MHQLRVHLAAIGHPFRNDPLYDPAAEPGAPFFLRAVRVTWQEPPGTPPGTAWTFEAAASEMIPA
jgi:23S rRNA-/tRNA-specific pseudouridylate synthase